jgi:hypothetical protein
MHPKVNELRFFHVEKFYSQRLHMKRILILAVLLSAFGVAAQTAAPTTRTAELDKAYEDARAAQLALQQAEARRDQGVESQPGERSGTAAGGSRPNENYFARQAILEQEVMQARRRYEQAPKHWNDLK